MGSLIVATGIAIIGCGQQSESSASESEPSASGGQGDAPAAIAYDHAYTVRGRIESMPGEGSVLRVRHEPIHSFLNRNNELVGMNAMVMEFPDIADGVSIEGLEAGDAVALTFVVDWSSTARPWTVTSLDALEGEPTLDLSGIALPERNDGADERAAEPVRRYTVRGVVRGVPDPEVPGSPLQVRHEAIDGFVDAEGEVVGMDAMVMPFPEWSDGVPVERLEVGDRIVFGFEMDWTGQSPAPRITALRVLDPETELVFRSAEPPR